MELPLCIPNSSHPSDSLPSNLQQQDPELSLQGLRVLLLGTGRTPPRVFLPGPVRAALNNKDPIAPFSSRSLSSQWVNIFNKLQRPCVMSVAGRLQNQKSRGHGGMGPGGVLVLEQPAWLVRAQRCEVRPPPGLAPTSWLPSCPGGLEIQLCGLSLWILGPR